MLPGIFYYLRPAKTFYMTVPLMLSFEVYHVFFRISAATLFNFRVSGAALIRGRRLFKKTKYFGCTI